MEYHPLQEYLARFATLTPPNASVRRAARDAIVAVCGVTIPLERIRVVRGVIQLDIHPLERAEIALAKRDILLHIRKEVPGATVKDIR